MIERPDFFTHPIDYRRPEARYVSDRFGADPEILPFLMMAAEAPPNLLGRPLLNDIGSLSDAARARMRALDKQMKKLGAPFDKMLAPGAPGRLSLVPGTAQNAKRGSDTEANAARPWLSVVAVSRNDDHGARMLERNQAFVDALVRACARGTAPVELVLVEWNPPGDRVTLAEALDFPTMAKNLTIRLVRVPNEIHNRYLHASRLPLYQMIGKNVGIRRAAGEYILATNVDILFSDALTAILLKSGEEAFLKPDRFYRSDRWDLDPGVLDFPSVEDVLDAAEDHTRRLNLASGSVAPFRSPLQGGATAEPRTRCLPELHLNACGDFQLAHRNAWRSIRGYPEFDGYSFHLDSLASYQLHFAGFREVRLAPEAMHFHIDHLDGWSPEAERDGEFRESLKSRGLPTLRFLELLFFAHLMRVCEAAILFNDIEWGLGEFEMPTEVVCRSLGERVGVSIHHEREVSRSSNPGRRYNPFEETNETRQARLRLEVFKTCLRHTVSEVQERRATRRGRQRPLAIWGAGKFGETIAAGLAEFGVEADYFIDGLAQDDNGVASGYPVKPVDFVQSALSCSDSTIVRPFIIIASSFADDIRDQLIEFGAEPGADFIVPA